MSQEELNKFYDAKEKLISIYEKRLDKKVEEIASYVFTKIREDPHYKGTVTTAHYIYDQAKNPTSHIFPCEDVAKALKKKLELMFGGNLTVKCSLNGPQGFTTSGYTIRYNLKKREQTPQ